MYHACWVIFILKNNSCLNFVESVSDQSGAEEITTTQGLEAIAKNATEKSVSQIPTTMKGTISR